jgi:hypothetical protein
MILCFTPLFVAIDAYGKRRMRCSGTVRMGVFREEVRSWKSDFSRMLAGSLASAIYVACGKLVNSTPRRYSRFVKVYKVIFRISFCRDESSLLEDGKICKDWRCDCIRSRRVDLKFLFLLMR